MKIQGGTGMPKVDVYEKFAQFVNNMLFLFSVLYSTDCGSY